MGAALAHLSDLHLGASPRNEKVARALVAELEAAPDTHVVVTGDITDTGRLEEFELFARLFSPLERAGRLTVVPGNHDRMGDDVAALLTGDLRVWVESRPGLTLVCVDSTAPHNRVRWQAHGVLCEQALAEVDQALASAPRGALTAVLLHHHPVPLPEETLAERFAGAVGWPFTAELHLGGRLLSTALGRADLVLHGHRHLPRHFRADGARGRPLSVLNAGSTTAMRAWRTLERAPATGALTVRWHHLEPTAPHPVLARPTEVGALALGTA